MSVCFTNALFTEAPEDYVNAACHFPQNAANEPEMQPTTRANFGATHAQSERHTYEQPLEYNAANVGHHQTNTTNNLEVPSTPRPAPILREG